jgi:RimJ/RimL family protein N-acetyltransferase
MVRRFGWGAPLTRPASQVVVHRWVRSWQSLGLERNLAIVDEVTGQIIGDYEAELRGDGFVHVLYAVFAPWRGRGVAKRAVRLMADHSADAFPYYPLLFRVERIMSRLSPSHARSEPS